MLVKSLHSSAYLICLIKMDDGCRAVEAMKVEELKASNSSSKSTASADSSWMVLRMETRDWLNGFTCSFDTAATHMHGHLLDSFRSISGRSRGVTSPRVLLLRVL